MTTTILPNGLQVRIAPCSNCDRVEPIAALGRCRGCYQFFHRHGCDRPPGSVKTRPSLYRRRCDCGQNATHERTIQIGKYPHLMATTLYLCDDCLKLETQK